MSEDDKTKKAREIAWARYSFRWHLAAYVIVNSGLVGLWGWAFPGLYFQLFFG